MPRDTGSVPVQFVLSVLYRHQPCEMSSLWNCCAGDSRSVLDSRKHLRDVLHEARAQGFVYFELNPHTERWECHLTRERYHEVRDLVRQSTAAGGSESGELQPQRELAHDHDGNETTSRSLMVEEKSRRLAELEEQLRESTVDLKQYQSVEVDYLPFTDLNGRVQFMWWYETSEAAAKAVEASPTTSLLEEGDTAQVEEGRDVKGVPPS